MKRLDFSARPDPRPGNNIEKLKKKGVDNVNRVLETLTKCQMISTMSDEKEETEYFGLISDFFVKQCFIQHLN